jgi:hypothetical protein
MRKIISIEKAKYLEAYKIKITFSDSTENIIDFKEFLEASKLPDLKKYLKLQNFKKFKVKSGNLIWGDFEMIFPIKNLYENHLIKMNSNTSRIA